MHLNIFVSKSCFVYCKGCYSYSREENCKSVLSSNQIVEFLQYAYVERNISKVTLCGGDPLARDDIIELLQKIKDIGYIISLDTVGTPLIKDAYTNKKLIKKVNAKRFADLVDVIGIPIDGSCNDVIKLFRNTKSDILQEQLSICKVLHKYKAKICINTVVHKGNLNDAEKLAEIVKNLKGIYKWQIFQFAPLGKFGYTNRKQFMISESEFKLFKKEVLSCYGNSNRIEFKESMNRVNNYMLIDNSGNAWIPNFKDAALNQSDMHQEERLVIGNIKNKNDWDIICKYLKEKEGVLK